MRGQKCSTTTHPLHNIIHLPPFTNWITQKNIKRNLERRILLISTSLKINFNVSAPKTDNTIFLQRASLYKYTYIRIKM